MGVRHDAAAWVGNDDLVKVATTQRVETSVRGACDFSRHYEVAGLQLEGSHRLGEARRECSR